MFNIQLVKKAMATVIQSNKDTSITPFHLEQDEILMREFEGCSFIWIVSKFSTMLVPLKKGFSPTHVTYYANRGCHQFFIIDNCGKLVQIEADKAVELIMELPFRVSAYKGNDMLRLKVIELFSTPRLNSSGLVNNNLYPDDFTGWYDWFVQTKNHLMADFTNQVISRF